MSMSKVEKKKKKKKTTTTTTTKMVWSILKEVHFWAASPSIGHYREPLNAVLPQPFQDIRCGSLRWLAWIFWG